MKSRVLIVGDFNRNDFQYAAKIIKDDAEIFFIEYLNKKKVKLSRNSMYGEVLFWKDYTSAYDLLEKIKPVKVISGNDL